MTPARFNVLYEHYARRAGWTPTEKIEKTTKPQGQPSLLSYMQGR